MITIIVLTFTIGSTTMVAIVVNDTVTPLYSIRYYQEWISRVTLYI